METNSSRIRVRLSPESLAIAEANANNHGLTFGEYLAIVLSTPAPSGMLVSELVLNIHDRLEKAKLKGGQGHG